MTPDQILHSVSAIVAMHVDVRTHKLYLFGSRAKGTPKTTSDFDFAIKGPTALSAEVLSRILDQIGQIDSLYGIDMVDYYSVDANFRAVLDRSMVEVAHDVS